MPIDDKTLTAFADDHGAPFAKALGDLNEELGAVGADTAASRCIAILAEEAEIFGRVRDGDPAPALRILALDGALTEALGDATAS